PMFARNDDINLAYSAANTVVTLSSPDDSMLATKVGGGHNCWSGNDAVCADIMATWIGNWAGDLVGTGGREIELEAPALRDPGQSKNFPDDSALFEATVYPVLAANCAQCHSSSAALQQQPFFAEVPQTEPVAVDTAYAAARARINLDSPSDSRFVVRLADEFHNCWTASCSNDAAQMAAAIQSFADGVPLTSIDPALLTSKALTLYEGTIASGGNRYEASTIALWEFKTGTGGTAYDTSGVPPSMDLTLTGAFQWFGGWGINFAGGKAQATTAASTKLHTMLQATGEYTIEAWVAPGNVVQEDTRIVSYSAGTMNRNFNLGQTMYNYDFFSRTSNSDANGNPQMSTPDEAEALQATLQHVVATFDPVDGRKIYVNGILIQDQDSAPGGNLADWDETYAFVLGNEVSGDRPWQGVVRLAAIHSRALNQAQILQNFEAGVGERFFLLFGVEHLTDVPESFIVMEAAQYDSYAYLFREPRFISLDGTQQPDGIDISGIRVGINGIEAPVGQVFARIDATVSSLLYDSVIGQTLATLGGVIPLQKGPELDEFFLTFDAIDGQAFSRPPPAVPPPVTPTDLDPMSDIGVRTFEEISASYAAITGVDRSHPGVLDTYFRVRQSMPTIETPEGFLASHQVAIAQLAIEYCNALIDDAALRTSMFPGFPFTSGVNVAFPGAGPAEDLLYDPLLNRVLGSALAPLNTQPDIATVKAELDGLVHGIASDGEAPRPGLAAGGGDATRTQTIAKSVCTAVLGSGVTLVQ
ncbi:MAG TPA: LamG domain-containing protein, partial [Gammaproteobacteria bacterium]|nr:LamG domain-containing protein [Gammaproteobacteria bacterium]